MGTPIWQPCLCTCKLRKCQIEKYLSRKTENIKGFRQNIVDTGTNLVRGGDQYSNSRSIRKKWTGTILSPALRVAVTRLLFKPQNRGGCGPALLFFVSSPNGQAARVAELQKNTRV